MSYTDYKHRDNKCFGNTTDEDDYVLRRKPDGSWKIMNNDGTEQKLPEFYNETDGTKTNNYAAFEKAVREGRYVPIERKPDIVRLLEACRECNAGIMKSVFRDEDDKPMWAFILVDGEVEVNEVVEAVEKVEDSWHNPNKSDLGADV